MGFLRGGWPMAWIRARTNTVRSAVERRSLLRCLLSPHLEAAQLAATAKRSVSFCLLPTQRCVTLLRTRFFTTRHTFPVEQASGRRANVRVAPRKPTRNEQTRAKIAHFL